MIRIRLPLAIPTATLFFATALYAVEPAPGSTRAEVEAELGKPTALRSTPDGDIAVYTRGTVTYRAGSAAELKLIPRETWLKQVEARKKAAEEAGLRAERQAAEYARLLAEAVKARETLLASESFKQLSPAAKVARLNLLLIEHPKADVALLRADLAKSAAGERDYALRLSSAEAACAESDRKLTEIVAKLEETRRELDAANGRAQAATKRIDQLELNLNNLAANYRGMSEIVSTKFELPAGGITTKQVISK